MRADLPPCAVGVSARQNHPDSTKPAGHQRGQRVSVTISICADGIWSRVANARSAHLTQKPRLCVCQDSTPKPVSFGLMRAVVNLLNCAAHVPQLIGHPQHLNVGVLCLQHQDAMLALLQCLHCIGQAGTIAAPQYHTLSIVTRQRSCSIASPRPAAHPLLHPMQMRLDTRD